jgi:hypothetical protein
MTTCEHCGREAPHPYRVNPVTGHLLKKPGKGYCAACFEALARRADADRRAAETGRGHQRGDGR